MKTNFIRFFIYLFLSITLNLTAQPSKPTKPNSNSSSSNFSVEFTISENSPECKNSNYCCITSYCISPSGKFIAFTSMSDSFWDNKLTIYNLEKRDILKTFFIKEGTKVSSCNFSSDNSTFAWNTTGNENYVSIYKLKDGTYKTLSIKCRTMQLSPIGNMLVTCTDGTAWNNENFNLIDISTGNIIRTIFNEHNNSNFNLTSNGYSILIPTHASLNICNFLPQINCNYFNLDNQYLPFKISPYNENVAVYGTMLKIYSLRDFSNKTVEQYVHSNKIDVCYTPLDKFLIYNNGESKKIYIYSIENNSKSELEIYDSQISNLNFSNDGKYFLYLADYKIKVCKIESTLHYLKIYQKYFEDAYKQYLNNLKSVYDNTGYKTEFELKNEYEDRLLTEINHKMDLDIGLYGELNDKINFDLNLENEKYSSENKVIQDKIESSIEYAEVKIDKVGVYDSEKEILPVTIKDVNGTIKIARNEAKSLKENFQNAVVRCKKKLKYDLKQYEYFDFLIIHPDNGKEYKLL